MSSFHRASFFACKSMGGIPMNRRVTCISSGYNPIFRHRLQKFGPNLLNLRTGAGERGCRRGKETRHGPINGLTPGTVGSSSRLLVAGKVLLRNLSAKKSQFVACVKRWPSYLDGMALTNLGVVEEALSLPPVERADLAKLLIDSLEGDRRTDEEIKAELAKRLEQLRSGTDSGFTFEQVFESPL